MSGSGLREVLEVIYSSNTVVHMISGKALARAVRGHMLVDSALNAMLVNKAFHIWDTTVGSEYCQVAPHDEHSTLTDEQYQPPSVTSASDTEDICDDMGKVLKLYDQLMDGKLSAEQVCSDRCLDTFNQKIGEWEELACIASHYMSVRENDRHTTPVYQIGENWKCQPYAEDTSRYVTILFCFRAQFIFKIRLHASTANAQTRDRTSRCVWFFNSGYHVVRWSDRYWEGLLTDLVIEQVLRTIKTTGGLTRSRGTKELQRAKWYTFHACVLRSKWFHARIYRITLCYK